MKAKKYKLKNEHLEAIKWDGTEDCYKEIVGFAYTAGGSVSGTQTPNGIELCTYEWGEKEPIEVGDYVLSVPKGIFAVMGKSEFESTYEPIGNEGNPIARAISTVMKEVLEKMPSDLKADNERLRTLVTELQQKVYELEKKNPPSDT